MTDLLVERYEAHALLTLNRPEKRNALSVALRDAISDTLDSLVRDDGMKLRRAGFGAHAPTLDL
jgi:enoyl-CoA hydratase/carnithine racemase